MSAAAAEVDFDALTGDTQRQLEELREKRQALTLDALTDPRAAKRLASVEADMAAAEQALERVDLARQERTRRDRQAEADEQATRPAEALGRARELQRDRQALALELDEAAAAYARKLRAYDLVTTKQAQALGAAGWSSQRATVAWPKSRTITDALMHALIAAEVPAGMVRLESPAAPFRDPASGSFHRLGRPLAKADVRLVEPAEEAS